MYKILISTSSFDLANIPELCALESAGFEFILNPYARRLSENEISTLLEDNVVGLVAGVEPLTSNVLHSAQLLKLLFLTFYFLCVCVCFKNCGLIEYRTVIIITVFIQLVNTYCGINCFVVFYQCCTSEPIASHPSLYEKEF